MQRRSKNKKSNPGKIDVSVSGHVKPNETATQAMLREASEEIGIKDRHQLCHEMKKIAENQIDYEELKRRVRQNDSEMLILKSEQSETIFSILDEKIKKIERRVEEQR